MTKSFRKAIMLRSKLKNNFNKQRSDKNWDNYQKQRNVFVKLLRQTKEIYDACSRQRNSTRGRNNSKHE